MFNKDLVQCCSQQNFRGQGQPQRRLTEHRVTEGYLWRTVEVMVDILDDDDAGGVLGEMTCSLPWHIPLRV